MSYKFQVQLTQPYTKGSLMKNFFGEAEVHFWQKYR